MEGEVIAFGIQVHDTGRKSFTLDYMFEGRRWRLFIGDFPDWSTNAAREQAKRIRASSIKASIQKLHNAGTTTSGAVHSVAIGPKCYFAATQRSVAFGG